VPKDDAVYVGHILDTCRSREFQDRDPEIPWAKIIGMRHKVVHDYLSVDYDLVWDVVTVNLPQLAIALDRIVPPDEQA
jgi:uncharacterized protein with HEPN domain